MLPEPWHWAVTGTALKQQQYVRTFEENIQVSAIQEFQGLHMYFCHDMRSQFIKKSNKSVKMNYLLGATRAVLLLYSLLVHFQVNSN